MSFWPHLAFHPFPCHPSATFRFIFFLSSVFPLSSCRLFSQWHVVQSGSLSGGCTLCVCAWDGRQAWPIYQTLLSPPPPLLSLPVVDSLYICMHLYCSVAFGMYVFSIRLSVSFSVSFCFSPLKRWERSFCHLHSRGCFLRCHAYVRTYIHTHTLPIPVGHTQAFTVCSKTKDRGHRRADNKDTIIICINIKYQQRQARSVVVDFECVYVCVCMVVYCI